MINISMMMKSSTAPRKKTGSSSHPRTKKTKKVNSSNPDSTEKSSYTPLLCGNGSLPPTPRKNPSGAVLKLGNNITKLHPQRSSRHSDHHHELPGTSNTYSASNKENDNVPYSGGHQPNSPGPQPQPTHLYYNCNFCYF